MGVSWTREQQQVIGLRDRSLLVSAAAGSGKTAVLVQRIIEKICDSSHPVDVDRLLVVTFTNAAAGEMRERVQKAIEKRLEAEPDNEHLKRQEVLVGQAHITTIDSFCLSVLREHFQEAGIDPSFRIGDEGELKLLQEDVLAAMLEEEYAEAGEGFLNFMESYAAGRDDGAAASMILELYGFAMANPRPEDWLEHCLDSYRVQCFEELEEQPWMKRLLENTAVVLGDYADYYDRILELCFQEDGPSVWTEMLRSEQQALRSAAGQTGYQAVRAGIFAVSFGTKPRKKKTDTYSDETAARAWEMREQVKKLVTAMQAETFMDPPERVLHKQQAAGRQIGELVRLTRRFLIEYRGAKRRRRLIDFSDMEHLALEILSQKTPRGEQPTQTALEYRDCFDEILIDEYQDSNYVQELILTSISRTDPPNLFMVGDVKQSIYRFRQARPELFMEKYESYSPQESLKQKIELHQNFRSRANILDTVNYFFSQLMQKSVGNVEYDAAAALYPGMEYAPCTEHSTGGAAELLLLDLEQMREEEDDTATQADDDAAAAEAEAERETDYSSREWEAVMIGRKIREIVDPKHGLHVWDKGQSVYRPAEYRDIAILLRTVSGWAEKFIPVLLSMGIPAAADAGSGYFAAQEVQVTLSLLEIIDNPLQDIPLTAVLCSAIGGFTNRELSRIRASVPKGQTRYFYEALLAYAAEPARDELGVRVNAFLRKLDHYRRKSQILTISELVRYLLSDSGYYDYVCAMPGAAGRRANLDMLLTRAQAFEKTSYQGVFQFVRYINRLKKYSVDYAVEQGEGAENQVRIMSIHKSKGLEFPVCFVAGTGKAFNRRDMNASVLYSADDGIGTDVIDPVKRTKEKTLMKQAIRSNAVLEGLGEELRVLYVAMTRAREKLYITGAKSRLPEYLKKQLASSEPHRRQLPYHTITGAGCFLDWITAAAVKHRGITPFCTTYGLPVPFSGVCFHDGCELSLEICGRQELAAGLVIRRTEDAVKKAVLAALAEGQTAESSRDSMEGQAEASSRDRAQRQAEDTVRERVEYSYRYDSLSGLHAAFTVSELKRLSLQEEETATVLENSEEKEDMQTLPEFLQEQQRPTAAARGTLYHRVFELLSFRRDIKSQLRQLCSDGLLREQELQQVYGLDFIRFQQSELGIRAAKAEAEGRYHRETPFILGVPAEEMMQQKEPVRNPFGESRQEYVSIQGVIDAWFEEQDGIVLFDFKTDRLRKGMNEAEFEAYLIRHYALQLQYYRRALEQMTGRPVKEAYLYSVSLGREIRLPV